MIRHNPLLQWSIIILFCKTFKTIDNHSTGGQKSFCWTSNRATGVRRWGGGGAGAATFSALQQHTFMPLDRQQNTSGLPDKWSCHRSACKTSRLQKHFQAASPLPYLRFGGLSAWRRKRSSWCCGRGVSAAAWGSWWRCGGCSPPGPWPGWAWTWTAPAWSRWGGTPGPGCLQRPPGSAWSRWRSPACPPPAPPPSPPAGTECLTASGWWGELAGLAAPA